MQKILGQRMTIHRKSTFSFFESLCGVRVWCGVSDNDLGSRSLLLSPTDMATFLRLKNCQNTTGGSACRSTGFMGSNASCDCCR
uniref:Uncharacterized protein n=1 Tax=Romanomermis culicivorax TaxID=13658 RepID=A0A915JDX6_ROMCU